MGRRSSGLTAATALTVLPAMIAAKTAAAVSTQKTMFLVTSVAEKADFSSAPFVRQTLIFNLATQLNWMRGRNTKVKIMSWNLHGSALAAEDNGRHYTVDRIFDGEVEKTSDEEPHK